MNVRSVLRRRERSSRTVASRIGSVVAVMAIAAGVIVATPQIANAAYDTSSFNAGNLISDTLFYDGTATGEADIQSLLNAKGASCTAAGTLLCLKDFRANITASAADSYCKSIPAQSKVSAAHIFATVGVACSINPAVLVVTVQKEESLVTRSSPTTLAYEHAMGYNCSDSAPCSTATAGFYNQIYHAARQFQHYRQSPKSYHFQPGAYNSISYHAGCGAPSVFIENYATAGLYDYTPYQPNKAALAATPGTGDSCSSYGNRNFWYYFTSWFGNTGNLLKASSFEGKYSGWDFSSGVKPKLVAPASGTTTTAQAGQYYLLATSPTSGRSVYQTVKRKLKGSYSYEATVWVRSSTSTPYTGRLILQGLGGSSETATTSFTAGGSWTAVTTDLTVHRAGHTSLRMKVSLDTAGAGLEIDSTDLSPLTLQPAAATVALTSPSFESGATGWAFHDSLSKRIGTDAGGAEDGSHYLVVNAPSTGREVIHDVPWAAAVGDTYTATVWVKSATTAPYTGSVSLYGYGSLSEHATTAFTVGNTWTPVMVNLPNRQAGVTKLRLEIGLGTKHASLDIDNASLAANLVTDGIFAKTVSGLTASSGTPTIARATLDPTVTGLITGTGGVDFTAPASGGTGTFTFTRRLVAGETYTASAWVRTTDATASFSGTLSLAASGGAAQSTTTSITGVSGAWTHIQTSIVIQDATNKTLKISLVSNSPGVQLELNGVILQ